MPSPRSRSRRKPVRHRGTWWARVTSARGVRAITPSSSNGGGSRSPAMASSSLVLPQPLGPISAIRPPRTSSNDSRSIRTRPSRRRTRFATLQRHGQRLGRRLERERALLLPVAQQGRALLDPALDAALDLGRALHLLGGAVADEASCRRRRAWSAPSVPRRRDDRAPRGAAAPPRARESRDGAARSPRGGRARASRPSSRRAGTLTPLRSIETV